MHSGRDTLSLPLFGFHSLQWGLTLWLVPYEDGGMGVNFIYWLEAHISEGLRFPLPPLVHQVFHFTRLHPIHTHVNIILVLLGVCVLNH